MQSGGVGLATYRSSFLSDLIDTIVARGRTLLNPRQTTPEEIKRDLVQLSNLLLSQRGEASGVALARALLEAYRAASDDDRWSFAGALRKTFGADLARLDHAIENYRKRRSDDDLSELHNAAEPRRQELFRRINLASGGTADLVAMREDLMRFSKDDKGLRSVDADFVHLFSSWFNRGFLVLRRIDWGTPGNILEKIIRYEAIHAIDGWDDLRSRRTAVAMPCFIRNSATNR